MSYNPFAIEPSILARLTDTEIAAASQGAWDTIAPPSIESKPGSLPYIIFEMIDCTFDPMTFEHNVAEVTYRVHVIDHKKNGLVPSATLIGLIYGDSEGTDNNPTYGLARWRITGVSDLAPGTMRPTDAGTLHEVDKLHYWIDFAIEVQEA